jgi:polyferredoxin
MSLGPVKAVKTKIERRVFWACIWSLVALALIVWALVHPKPLPVIVAMSVGQIIGTISLLLFLGSIALDLRSRYKITQRGQKTPTPPPSSSK